MTKSVLFLNATMLLKETKEITKNIDILMIFSTTFQAKIEVFLKAINSFGFKNGIWNAMLINIWFVILESVKVTFKDCLLNMLLQLLKLSSEVKAMFLF